MARVKVKSNPKATAISLSQLPEESFRSICDRMPAMVAVYNVSSGKYLYVSPAIKKLLGYRPEDFTKGGMKFVVSLVHPDDLQKINIKNSEALEQANNHPEKDPDNEPIVNFDYRMRHVHGHYLWLHTDGSVFSRKNGRIESVLNISIDISNHKEAEAKLAKTNTKLQTAERFKLSQRVAKVGTFEWQLEKNRVVWSPELEQLYGLTSGTFEGTYEDWIRRIHPEDRKKVEKSIKSAISGNSVLNTEFHIFRGDGSVRWMLVRGELIKDKTGKPIRFVGANVDITDRKDIEAKLRANEERYQAFIRNSSEAIWRVELDEPIPINLSPSKQVKLMYERSYLAEANDAMAVMYGLKSVKGMLGARLNDLLVESDPKNTEYLKAFIKSGYSLSGAESHEKDQNGNDKYFINSLVGFIENGCLIRAWGTQQDVTEQRKSAEKLRKSEERLNLALRVSQVGIWEWDINANKLNWSEQLKKLFGLKPRAIITYKRYLSLIHPIDLPKIEKATADSLKSGQAYQVEFRAVWPDGSVHWLLGQGQAIIKDNKPVRILGTTVNIDERKSAEKLKMQAALLNSQRKELIAINDAKDEFIALASHQLRTPATGVKQYLGMLLQGYIGKVSLTKEQSHMLKVAYESNERQLRIVDDLLLVAQLDAGKVKLNKERVDLIYLIKCVTDEQRSKFESKNQKVILSYHEQKIIADIDQERMRMALENLVDNASKYSPKGSPVTIDIWHDEARAAIRIKDKGVGIDKKDQSKLFQKFSRIENPLSTSAGGTGLGLYWARKIIDLHGGRLEVRSKVNRGSTFTVILPFADTSEAKRLSSRDLAQKAGQANLGKK